MSNEHQVAYERPRAQVDPRIKGGIVSSVDGDSPAQRAGIAPGDVITHAEGIELADALDWLWYADEADVEVAVLRGGEGEAEYVLIERESGEPWGIEWVDALFDGVRRCHNDCTFCFIKQLPAEMRSTLNIRDDDFRLSFLQGNFITLTNLTDDDVERIVEQHLSPLHVSVHAVTPAVREKLIGRNHEKGLERLDQLLDSGIEVHTQIVLVPGVNDAKELDLTLAYLAERRPGILSVGIVPVAHTDHLTGCGVDGAPLVADKVQPSFTGQAQSAVVIAQVQSYQFESRAATGETFVHLADEFYIEAHAPFPLPEWYDDFPQYENGIGMVVSYVADIKELAKELYAAVEAISPDSHGATVVVGELATGTMLGTLSALHAGGRVRVLPVKNRFFGGNVTVTGLLTGSDIVAAIRYDAAHLEQPTRYIVPAIIFNTDQLTLDGFTRERISEESGADIVFVDATAAGLLEGLQATREE